MKRLTTLAALFAATTLAACSGGSDAPPPPPNETENVVIVDETPTENVATVAEPEVTPTPTPSPTPLAEDLPDDQQVQEDADAVGMTSRLPRTEETPAAQPAE